MLATQSGPLLVHGGRLHPAFKPNSTSRLLRFAISEAPVNFYEFAALFRDKLGCPDALFLDENATRASLSRLEISAPAERNAGGPG